MGSWSADEVSRSELTLTNPKSSKITMKPIEKTTQGVVATTSGTKASKSKLSDDEAATRSSTADDDIEEDIASISEHISFDDSNMESESASGQINAINLKKRQLFDIGNANDDEDDDLDGPLFNDTLLSGGHIAQHFRVSDQSEHSDSEHIDDSLDDNAVSGSKSQHSEHSRINSQSAAETSKNSRNVDSAEQQQLNQQQQQQQRPPSQSSTKLDASNAENSAKGGILEEGVILINNDQVSLNTLKNLQVHHQSAPMPQPISTQTSTITQNTTNDISDIMADDDDELSLSHLVQEKAKIRRNKTRSMEHEVRMPADLRQTCRSLNSSFRAGEDDSEAMHSDRSKDSSSYEEDHSIEEVAVSNASIDMSQRNEIFAPNQTVLTENFSNLSELDSNIDINNESQMNRILADTIESLPHDVFDGSHEPLDSLDVIESQMNKILADTVKSIPDDVFKCHQEPLDSLDNQEAHAIVIKTLENLPKEIFERHQEPIDSLEYLSDGILELKERILERSEATKVDDLRSRLTDSYAFEVSEDDDQPELIQPPVVVIVKQMEKVDYSKEALEDISEESMSSLEPQPSTTNLKIELGAVIPRIIQKQNVPIVNTKDGRNMLVDKDPSVDEENANSFDSVVSLNMLQTFENKIKELEAIVATKDVCLTALNMQLESVYRRDSLKDMPPALDSCSLATSSTEYRTYQEEYANHRVI